MCSWIWNFCLLSFAERDMEYLEYLRFKWVHATSKPLYIFPAYPFIEHWTQEGKHYWKSLLDQLGNQSLIILETKYLFHLNSNKLKQNIIWVELCCQSCRSTSKSSLAPSSAMSASALESCKWIREILYPYMHWRFIMILHDHAIHKIVTM